MENIAWHSEKIESVFQKLDTSPDGLDFHEAKKRLRENGLNVLEIKSSNTVFRIILRQLQNPIVYVLLFSTLFAFLLKKFNDGVVVFAIVILNTMIGFFQEYRASRIIRALSAMLPHKTTVIRNGQQKSILASEVTVGDVIYLQSGDRVPADMRLFSIKNLQCDESALTGESVPVFKQCHELSSDTHIAERKCMVFSGTFVATGTGFGVVVAIGPQTEFGKISELIEHVETLETPLSQSLMKIASWISYGVVIAGVFLFAIGYLRGSSLFDSGLAAVALAVAAIPEGLPAIVTITSAIGVHRMGRRRAIIRQLPAVEVLGSTTVICTDKTGTLTLNEMTAQSLYTLSGFSDFNGEGFNVLQDEIIPLLKAVVICCDATVDVSPVGDPTEIALVNAGRKVGINETLLRSEWHRDDVIPFEPERRIMATLNTSPSKNQYIFVKGAPEVILPICMTPNSEVLQKIDEMATQGMRVIAVAEKQVENHLESLEEHDIKGSFKFLGLIGLLDPPRKEVYKALKTCHEAGITVKMVTGDHPVTARAIGRILGLLSENEDVITGSELDKLSDEKWKDVALNYQVFARVLPEHKLKLVTALQETQNVVAMTGDGVNDAPALKRADIGISMGIKGTAVAKEASDMILADDNFASIEAAVEEGRRVYDNLIKALIFILPTSLGQAFVILIAVLFFPMQEGTLLQPIMPVQILWINLIVAVALALPLAFEAAEPDIMHRPPRKKSAPILSPFLLIRTFTVAILMALGAVGLFLWEYHTETSKGILEVVALREAQTMAVTSMVFFQIFYLFHCRSLKTNVLSNPSILFGAAIVILAQFLFTYLSFMNEIFYSSSIDLKSWVVSIAAAFVVFLVVPLQKLMISPRGKA